MSGGDLRLDVYVSAQLSMFLIIGVSTETDKTCQCINILQQMYKLILPSLMYLLLAVVSQLQIHPSNPFFVVLRLGLDKPHFCFASRSCDRLCQQGHQKKTGRLEDEERIAPACPGFLYFRCPFSKCSFSVVSSTCFQFVFGNPKSEPHRGPSQITSGPILPPQRSGSQHCRYGRSLLGSNNANFFWSGREPPDLEVLAASCSYHL